MFANRFVPVVVVLCVLAGAVSPAPRAADRPNLAGRWTLNASLSQIPRELGFNLDLTAGQGAGAEERGYTGGGATAVGFFRESEEDARRRTLLVEEVRTPSPHLTIAQTDSAVTITDDRGLVRTFHPVGLQESFAVDQFLIQTTSQWNGDHLDIRYRVAVGREVEYSFARTTAPTQLVITVRLIERGGRDTATLVYEPSDSVTASSAASQTPAPAPATTSSSNAATSGLRGLPPMLTPPPPAPGSEFKGLDTIGVSIDELSPAAAGCGLKVATLDAAVSKSLTDAGFKVQKHADESTYVVVTVVTATPAPGLCVSRYDTQLYSMGTGTITYQSTPARLQATLVHRGGLAGGDPKSTSTC